MKRLNYLHAPTLFRKIRLCPRILLISYNTFSKEDKMLNRFGLHLGRRGTVMILMSALWLYVGVGIILDGPDPRDGLIHTLWPIWFRSIEWILPAVVAFFMAWRVNDTPGWVLLLLPPLIRAASFLYGWAVWQISDGADGYQDGAWSSILYLFMIGIVLTCAGWPDYPPRTPDRLARSE